MHAGCRSVRECCSGSDAGGRVGFGDDVRPELGHKEWKEVGKDRGKGRRRSRQKANMNRGMRCERTLCVQGIRMWHDAGFGKDVRMPSWA